MSDDMESQAPVQNEPAETASSEQPAYSDTTTATESAAEGTSSSEEGSATDSAPTELPYYAKQRLAQQKKHYEKRIRQLEQQFKERTAPVVQLPISPYGVSGYGDVATATYPEAAQDENPIRAEVKAVFDEIKRTERKQAEQATFEQQQAYKSQQISSFEDRLNEFGINYDDFDETVRNPDLPLTQPMVETAMLVPNGPELLYHLGKNPAEVKRLAHLHPFDQAREMVKIGMSLQHRPNVSQAPPPVSPLSKGNHSTTSSIKDMTYSQMKQHLRTRKKGR